MLATGKQDKDCVVRPFNKKQNFLSTFVIFIMRDIIVCMWEKRNSIMYLNTSVIYFKLIANCFLITNLKYLQLYLGMNNLSMLTIRKL